MSRISLVKEYDNKDVIQQINCLDERLDYTRATADIAKSRADEALTRISGTDKIANEALSEAKTADTKATDAGKDAADAKAIAQAAKATADGSVSDVTIRTDNVSGTLIVAQPVGDPKEHPIPIASATQTGLMNAQTYAGITNIQARVTALEGKSTTVYVIFPSENPSQAEITSVFTSVSGRVPISGDYATDIAKAITYGYNGSKWVKVSQDSSIPQFALNEFGVIKGAPTSKDGAVIAETDGTGSVQGWDKVKSDIVNVTGTVANLDKLVNTKQVKLTGNKAVVSVSSWSDNKVTLSIPGVTADSIIFVAPEPASFEEYGKSGIYASAQGAGTLQLTSKTVPSTEITVNVVVA